MAERFAIAAGTIVPMNAPPIDDGAVIISGGKIERVVPRADLPREMPVEEHPESILLPAFVNCHTHLVYTSFRGLADDAGFFSWLTKNMIPLGLDRRDQECLESAREGVRLCLRHGITTVGENHYLPWGRQAMAEAGMKGVVFYEIFGVLTLNLARSIRAHREQIRRLTGMATDCIRCGIAPHAPYSVPISMARMAREEANEHKLPLSIHVGETHAEIAFFLRGEGPLSIVRRMVRFPVPDGKRTPLKYLDECGLLGPRTLLVHGIYLSDADLNIIADRGCTMVTCPTSNAKLGCGVARAGGWLRRGIQICIATDSPASGESFDMFEEMRRFVLFQRGLTGETEAFTAEQVLRMVTTNPAKALGMDDLVGDLRDGSTADLVLVKPDRSHVSPNRDIYQTLLWGTVSSDIEKVWSDGREVYTR